MEPSSSELVSPTGGGGTELAKRTFAVLLRRAERGEERTTQLTIRLIEEKRQGQRVLRIFIYSEADLFFLHVLEVGEEEYAVLRQEQHIRVDFANFAGNLIGLLDKCIADRENLPRFQAVLHAATGQGTFKVVENNEFKQLPHITLTFRPGNDAAVKQFLAFRLTELRSECSGLSSALGHVQSERNSLQNCLAEAKDALATTRQQHERHLLEYQADVKGREAAVLEAKAKELSDLREASLRERAELDSKYREQLEASQARVASLDTESRALREQKFQLDAHVSELSHKLGAAEGTNKSLTQEVERLRELSTQLGRAKAERDIELSEALTKVAALEDKVAAQAGLAAEQAQRMRDMEASLRQVQSRAEELKASSQDHQARAQEASSELAKANTTIEKMTNELEMQKEKVKRKAGIVSRQEEELAARDKAADEAQQRARNLQRDLERANEDAEALRKEVADMRGKLEDSRGQVASNEQMIRWLNNQITETQLHYSAGSASLLASRYSYRPAAPAPPASSSATTTGAGTISVAQMGGGGPPAGASGPAGARPAVSTYRTPVVPSTAGSMGATSAPAPFSAGSTAGTGSGDSMPARAGFRSSFYATHFGRGGGSGSGSGSGGQPASTSSYAPQTSGTTGSAAGSAAAHNLNLGAATALPAVSQTGGGGVAAAAPAGPSVAKYLSSRFEAPTYRMADTAAGRVAVPVTSGSA